MQLARRPFLLGVSLEDSGVEQSPAGDADLLRQLPQIAEVASVFFHVQWNALRKRPLLEGHERNLRVSDAAREAGAQLLLVFDFTHDGQDRSHPDLGVGQLNKFPDQTELPPGGLGNSDIREAYRMELLAAVQRIRPQFVRIGVEINIFHNAHPEMWPGFVEMYRACFDSIKERFPGIDVSAYTARPPTNAMMEALHDLLPCLDSLGYSFYDDAPWELPREHWTKICGLDPSKPLFIPEFGIRSQGGKVAMPDFGMERHTSQLTVDEDSQKRALQFLLDLFGSLRTQALVWFSLYDQDYSYGPLWFSSAHSSIGLLRRDGTAKPALGLWRDALGLARATG